MSWNESDVSCYIQSVARDAPKRDGLDLNQENRNNEINNDECWACWWDQKQRGETVSS